MNRWKAELAWVTGYIMRWFTCPQSAIQVRTGCAWPGVKIRNLLITSTTV